MPRGRLRIYLGAAPGVGKTYAMLLEGHRRVSQGDDCVVGFVEPHGRRATAALVEGLEVVPRRIVRYRGGTLEEIDVDAVLARHPRVALVDELAHTNAPGLHHSKRWQDVDELLDAGIDVVTTLNIQHLESLNDATAEMTGVRQRETLPDRVARRADEIELIDLSPEAIRRRMVAGVIYPPNRIDAALSHYFRPGNLTALRELALLWLADRVDEGLRRYREEHGIAAPWEARERIVVGVSGGPESDRVIRRAARLVARTPGSDLLAVYVARTDGRLGADAASLARCRALVESLGGSWHQVVGVDIAQALGQFARHENATQLVVGASRGFGFRGMLIGREIVARRVSRLGGMLDIHVLTDERPTRRPLLVFPQVGGLTLRRQLLALAFVVAGLPLVTFVLTQLRGQLVLATDLLVYLLVVVVAGAIGGMYPSVVAAVASGVLADYFFTPPLHSFDVTRATDVVALVGFVAAGLVVSWLAELSARRRTLATRATAEAAAVTAMADSALKGQSDLPRLLELVREIFGLDAVSLLQFLSEPGVGNWQWFVVASAGDRPPETPERATVEAPPEPSPFVVAGRGPRLSPPDQQIFSACAALVVETAHHRRLGEEAASAQEQVHRAHQRLELLTGALRVLGARVATARRAVSELRRVSSPPTPEQAPLIETAEHALERTDLLLGQLSDLARARAGALDLHLRPVDLAEAVASVLEALGPDRHRFDIALPDALPDVIADAAVLVRLITLVAADSLRRSALSEAVAVTAAQHDDRVELHVCSRAPAVPTTGAAEALTGPEGRELAVGNEAVSLGIAEALAESMNVHLRTEPQADGGLDVILSLAAAAGPRPG